MKRGRPPLDEHDPSVAVSLKLPGKKYDELYVESRKERCSVPELIRRQMKTAQLVDADAERKK